MPVCLIGIGSNLGDRAENLSAAVDRIGENPQVDVAAVSRFHTTDPVGGPGGQGKFLNAAVRLATSLAPEALMRHLLNVEMGLGRRRSQRWGPRTVDLDILLYGQAIVRLPDLKIPHARMAFRRFVLEPAVEVAPELIHPEIGWTVARLLEHLNVATPYVAVAGLPGAGKSKLAAAVAGRTGAQLIRDPGGAAEPAGRAGHDRSDGRVHSRLLDRQWKALDQAGPVGEPTESISDFWLDQARAYAERWLSHHERAAYVECHEQARTRAVPPKLLVLLDFEPRDSAAYLRRVSPVESDVPSESCLAAIGSRLDQMASTVGRHPVLRLPAAEFERAVDETVAAVQTMR
jgi:2-amino-4-hydroxy-6-hydroxymethyldihydropteridine diphosphokinase